MSTCLLPVLLLISLASSASPQSINCVNPTAINPHGDSAVVTNVVTTTPNLAIYEWSTAEHAWVLVESLYSDFAQTETMQAGDIYLPPSTFGGGSGGGGGGGQVKGMELSPLADSVAARSPVGIDAVCEDTFKFPPIVVTGSAPPAGGGISRLAVFRPNPTSGGSGGGGFARPSGRAPSVDHSVNCSSEVESRVANARTSIAQVNPFARRNSIWTVLYNSGQRENFIVVDPFISAGVAPVGTCG